VLGGALVNLKTGIVLVLGGCVLGTAITLWVVRPTSESLLAAQDQSKLESDLEHKDALPHEGERIGLSAEQTQSGTALAGDKQSPNRIREMLRRIGASPEGAWQKWIHETEIAQKSLINDCLQVVDETTPKTAQAVLFQAAINEPKPEMLQVIADRYDSLPENSKMRTYFREMVQSFRDESMVEGLASLASTLTEAEFREDSLAWTAVGTLAQIGSAPSVDAILRLADNVEQELREQLLLPLQMYQTPEALTLIISVANSQGRTTSPALRIACIRLLGSYQEPKAQQALHDLSSNSDPNIAEVARSSLR
jgi:hypothetical protein